jgi:hypothetical protein
MLLPAMVALMMKAANTVGKLVCDYTAQQPRRQPLCDKNFYTWQETYYNLTLSIIIFCVVQSYSLTWSKISQKVTSFILISVQKQGKTTNVRHDKVTSVAIPRS